VYYILHNYTFYLIKVLVRIKTKTTKWYLNELLNKSRKSLTFMGPCIVIIFKYISNKMQRYRPRSDHFVYLSFLIYSYPVNSTVWLTVLTSLLNKLQINKWININWKCSWFQTFAVFCTLYVFFTVISRPLSFICWRFGALFCLHRRLGMKIPTRLWRWNRQSVPKRRHIKFRRRELPRRKHTTNGNLLIFAYKTRKSVSRAYKSSLLYIK
jgi:hypothetical protein